MKKLLKKTWKYPTAGIVAVVLVVVLMAALMPVDVTITQSGFLSVGSNVALAVNNQGYQIGDEIIEKRTRNSKTYYLGGNSYSWDGTIGAIHYEDDGWQEIDNYFEPATAPWDWQMLKAGYYIRVKEDFTAGQIIEFETQGETVQLQPMALEWTNDLDQIQLIAIPYDVAPVITNPEVDLLPAVGMLSHQGTITWDGAYGEGLDFEWQCASTRLLKTLEIEALDRLSEPEQYILDGGNPILRLNLIFAPSSNMDIYVDGELWDKSSKKQTFNIIEFRKGGEVLWGFMPLRYWGSGEGEYNEGQSIATLEKRGNNLYISIRVPYEWLQAATYPVFIDVDVDEQVGAGADDDTINSWDSTWVATGFDAWNFTACKPSSSYIFSSSARFVTVGIPQGAIISSAYLTVTARLTHSTVILRTNLCAEDEDNATQNTSYADFVARSCTSVVPWDGIGAFVSLTEYDTPSIVSPIQTVVDREGWTSGNALKIFWKDDGSDSGTVRYAYPYDKSTTLCAKLHIEYDEVTLQIEAGNCDAAELESSGNMNVADAIKVEHASTSSPSSRHWAGFRWPLLVTIPQGSEITVCYAQFYIYSGTYDNAYFYMTFQMAASPGVFTTATSNISGRSRTSANVLWNWNNMGTGWKTSPSLVVPLQEVVNTYSITTVVLINVATYSGAAKRWRPRPFEYDTGQYAALLHIEWTPPGAEPDITNAPSSKGFGILEVNTYSDTAINFFTIENTGSGAVDVIVYATDLTGGDDTWDLSDTATPGENIYGLKAGLDDDDDTFDVVVRETEAYNELVNNLLESTTQDWGLRLYMPTTVTNYDGQQMASTLTLVCSAH